MLTPQQNLEEADRLLRVLQEQVGERPMTVADTINLANARVTLALALNVVPLIGEFRDDYADLRDPRKLT